jgi:hypothetical protein
VAAKDVAVKEIAKLPGKPRAPIVLLDLRASPFNDMPILNARGTSCLAGSTVEASVNVRDEGVANR